MNSGSINTQSEIEDLKNPLLSGCNVCGRNHNTEECSFLRELKPVQDTKAPSRARLTLPANLEVQNLADNSTTVVARAPFPRNVQFGPFIAKHTQMLHPAVNFPLKVFGKSEEASYYLDTSDEETCNWMCLVAPATSCKDQNLICYQMDQNIYFAVMKDIQPGEQLKVWYAPYYAVKMGVVPFNVDLAANAKKKENSDHAYETKQKQKEREKKNFHAMLLSREVTEKLARQLPAKQLGARQVPDRWRCKLCSTEETSVVTFAKHLMTHYKRSVTVQGDKPLSCHLCQHKFATEKMLVKHKVVQHKVKVQRPKLLENVEDEERTGLDETDEEDASMTSIVIANLTPQFSQNGSQTIFVTNNSQVFPDTLAADSQNEVLNVLLEQLQSESAFSVSSEIQLEPTTNSTGLSCGAVDSISSLDTSKDSADSSEKNILIRSNIENTEAVNVLNHTALSNEFMKIDKPADLLSLKSLNSHENNIENSSNFDSSVMENCEDLGNDLLTKIQLHANEEVLQSENNKNISQNNRQESNIVQVHNDEFLSSFQSCSNEVMPKKVVTLETSEQNMGTSQSGDLHISNTKETGADKPEFEMAQNASLLNLISCTDLAEQSKTADGLNGSYVPAEEKSSDIGPPYNCDICNKEFHKADYLYRHLRKHTGEFTCVSCLAVFARKESLVNHSCFVDSNSLAENKSAHTCPYCQKVFHMKKLLKRHLAKHTGEWKCNNCQHIYSSRTTLAAHKCTSKRSIQMYHCQICRREFLRHSYLTKHMLLHRELHACGTCGKKLPAGETLKMHQHYCSQGKLLETTGEATCPSCSTSFIHVLTYWQHVLEHTHPFMCQQCGRRFTSNESRVLHGCTSKMLLCEVCLKSFSHMSEFLQHSTTHGVPQFHCYECGNSFHQSERCVNHVCTSEEEHNSKTKHKKKKLIRRKGEQTETEEEDADEMSSKSGGLVCDVCGDVYKTIHSLKAHRQLHGERRFECEVCGKRFHRKDVLQEHHTVHQVPQIPCPVCNKKLKTKKSLDVHMRCHTGERPYSCGECGKGFFQKGNLLKHATVHNPLAKKLLTCDHCNKNFTSRDYLSQHMLEHTQGRIYQCELCEKSFVKDHMLKAHIRQYHGGLIFVCPYCHMSVRYRQSIRRHLEKRHSDLQHEWGVQGFVDKLEANGNIEVSSNPVTSLVATSQQTSPTISNMDVLQTDTQEEGGEILLTVSRIPLVGTNAEVQESEEATDIGSQMELQVETEVPVEPPPEQNAHSTAERIIRQLNFSLADDENEMFSRPVLCIMTSNAFIFNGTVTQEDIAAGEGNILLYVLDTGDVALATEKYLHNDKY